MNEWGWAIAVAVLAITLVHLGAYYYLLREREGGSVRPSTTGDPGAPTGPLDRDFEVDVDVGVTDSDDPEGVRRCPECGVPNEPDGQFSFCRNCAAALS
jgi:hypothetical protein